MREPTKRTSVKTNIVEQQTGVQNLSQGSLSKTLSLKPGFPNNMYEDPLRDYSCAPSVLICPPSSRGYTKEDSGVN